MLKISKATLLGLSIAVLVCIGTHDVYAQEPAPQIDTEDDFFSSDDVLDGLMTNFGLGTCRSNGNRPAGEGIQGAYTYMTCTNKQVVNAIGNISIYVALLCVIWGGGLMVMSAFMGEQVRSLALTQLKTAGVGITVVLFAIVLANSINLPEVLKFGVSSP